MKDCLFCSIASGPKDRLVWENDVAAAFNDIHPKAPVHVLVVPKVHVENLDDLSDANLGGQIVMAARVVAEKVGIKGAYRVHINNGRAAGQVIQHLHLHLLGKIPAEDIEELRHDGL